MNAEDSPDVCVCCVLGDYQSVFAPGSGETPNTVIIRTDQIPFLATTLVGDPTVVAVSWTLLVFHEYGHAKQYIGSPEEYRKLTSVRGSSNYLPLEMDNLREHEWPLADELGVPRRTDYAAFAATEAAAIEAAAQLKIRHAWRSHTLSRPQAFNPTRILTGVSDNNDKVRFLTNIIHWYKTAFLTDYADASTKTAELARRRSMLLASAFLTVWQGLPGFKKRSFNTFVNADTSIRAALIDFADGSGGAADFVRSVVQDAPPAASGGSPLPPLLPPPG